MHIYSNLNKKKIFTITWHLAGICALILGSGTQVKAQVSQGGQPASLRFNQPLTTNQVTIPRPELQQILSQESIGFKEEPWQFGYAFDSNYQLHNSGVWQTLPDGSRIWRLYLKAEEAFSINLIFDDFYLAPEAKLFVYTPDYRFILGAFTSENNKPHGRFATAPTPGSECVLELNESAAVRERSHFTITRVIYGYKDLFAVLKSKMGGSGSCNVNVNAPQGAAWQNEKRAVAMVITDEGRRLCSGALINNVQEDYRQFFLTADHCLGGEETWIVMFNYEIPYGSNEDGPTTYTVQGATLRAQSAASDFALVELTETIPVEYRVYFAGWNASNTSVTQTTCIHHPMGDVKMISQDYQAPRSYTWSNTPTNSHWDVVWDLGTTESGSSGAPLFDQNHHIIGQLHGGFASCLNPSGSDYFGKFSFSWNYYSATNKQLKAWLDPRQSGRLILEGKDYYTIAINHQPLHDCEDTAGPYWITARVISYKPPLNYVRLIWGYDGDFSYSLPMTPADTENLYQAWLPGPQTPRRINYYFEALDNSGQLVTLPFQAPRQCFTFVAGSDTVKPQIVHKPLVELPRNFLPITITAAVTDNLGIDTVYCEFFVDDSAQKHIVGLQPSSINNYTATIPITMEQVQPGAVIGYRLYARDNAIVPNLTVSPAVGFYTLTVNDYRANILLVSDGADLKSAALCTHTLQKEGYYIQQSASSSPPASFEPFDLVIVSCGANPEPLGDSALRCQLQAWLTDTQHKLLIEGGNLAFTYPGLTERDTAFAHQVLHITQWRGDYAGSLHLDSAWWYHPIANQNYRLTGTIGLNYQTTADQDAVQPRPPAYGLFLDNAQVPTAGIVVYDSDNHPNSGQVVFLAFNLAALSDSSVARKLISNTVAYLLNPELPPKGCIQGRVTIADRNDFSGVIVKLHGPITATQITNREGEFAFTNLYDGFYQLGVHFSGYFCAESLLTFLPINQNQLTELNFCLEPIQPGLINGYVTLEGEESHQDVLISLVGGAPFTRSAVDGSFSISGITPGRVSLLFQKLGFYPCRIDTTLSNGAVLSLTVRLNRFLPPPANLKAIATENIVNLTWLSAGSRAEDFEYGLPSDWIVKNLGSDSMGTTWAVTTTNAFRGNQSVRCVYGQPEEVCNEWLITNPILISPQAFVLKFYHAGSFVEDDNLPNHVLVSHTSLDTADFTIVYTIPGVPNALPATWTQVAIDLSAYMGQLVYIAFQYQSRFGEIWYLDEITLEDNLTTEPGSAKIVSIPCDKTNNILQENGAHSPFPTRLGLQNLNLTAYQIYRSTTSQLTNAPEFLLGTVPAESLHFSDHSVAMATSYQYAVAASYQNYGVSPLTQPVTVTIENQPPPTPQNFTTLNVNAIVHLNWSPVNVPDLAGYQIWRAFGSESYRLLASTIATSFVDTLSTEGPYRYYLVAYDQGTPPLQSNPSEVKIVRYGKQPPENLTARSGLDSHVPLSWSRPILPEKNTSRAQTLSNMDNLQLSAYRIYRASQSPVLPLIDNLQFEMPISPSGDTVYADWNVTNGKTYYYVVTAVYSNGESIPSNEVCARPGIDYPLQLTIGERIDSLVLHWRPKSREASIPYDVLRMRLFRSTDGTQFNLIADYLTGTGYSDKQLVPGQYYWYYLNATTPDSQILTSNIVQAKFLSHDRMIWFDDFETAQISNQYTLIDYDRQPAFFSSEPLLFQPFAWLIRTAPYFSAYSGSYCLGTGYNLNGTPNDDWLILPPILPLGADVFLEFYLSGQKDSTIERAAVWASTTGIGPSDWNLLAAFDTIPASPLWRRAVVEISPAESNVYLAIQCRSSHGYSLKVDNLGIYGTGHLINTSLKLENPAARLALNPNYPNPFNATTTIQYQLPHEGQIRLTIYNLNGQVVKTLYNGRQKVGTHRITWNGEDDRGKQLASGIYFCRLESGNRILIQKLILMK